MPAWKQNDKINPVNHKQIKCCFAGYARYVFQNKKIKFLHVLQFSSTWILSDFIELEISLAAKERLSQLNQWFLFPSASRGLCFLWTCIEEGVKQRSGGRAVRETAPRTSSEDISGMGGLSHFLLVALLAQILSNIRFRSLGVWHSQDTKIWLLVLWEIHCSNLFLLLSQVLEEKWWYIQQGNYSALHLWQITRLGLEFLCISSFW